MAYNWIDPNIGLQPITETSTTQKHPIGLRAMAYDTTYGVGEFIYLKGVASTAAAEAVVFDEYANTTTRAVAGSRGPVAVSMSANVASQYGWYQISGAAQIKALAGMLANANCYATATNGSIDDAVVAGDKIDGMRSKTALDTPVTGQVVVQLAYPSLNANG